MIICRKSIFMIIWAEPQQNNFTWVCTFQTQRWILKVVHLQSMSTFQLIIFSHIFSSLIRMSWRGNFFKYLWQCFLNVIRLIAHKMRSLLCTQKQNNKSKRRRLRNLTINQELEKKTFAWKTTLFCNIQRLR